MRTQTLTKWFVSRQRQYYNGMSVVEVEINGRDYAGADMLVPKYGEGEYNDPREAIEVAIAVRDAWKADGADVDGITIGTTGGFGMEGEVFTGTDDDLRAIGQKAYDALPKCDRCGEMLEETFHLEGDSNLGSFCSEHCCEEVERQNYIENHLDEWRENAVKALLGNGKRNLAAMLKHRSKRPLTTEHIMRRFTLGRLARAVANAMNDREVEIWGSE